MANSNGWTPTERKFLDLLRGGEHVHRAEMLACLDDSEASMGTVHVHVANINSRLRAKGREILCVSRGKFVVWKMVRLLGGAIG